MSPKSIATNQRGTTLIVSLVMLLVVLMLSMSFAGMSLMNERAARNERDKLIAMHAAEAALIDAEQDIENSTSPNSRSAIFSPKSSEGFTKECGKGDRKYQGLCLSQGKEQAWSTIDLADTSPNSLSVPFGHFTGLTMPTGESAAGGPFPIQLPRYIIELMLDTTPGMPAHAVYFYRITAIGFGIDSTTQVVLQTVYRKKGTP